LDAYAIINVDDGSDAFAASPKRIVENQCLMLRDNLYPTWEHILENGTLVLILSLDGSGRIVFDSSNSKVEQGVTNIFFSKCA
jgi:hypothetical protein